MVVFFGFILSMHTQLGSDDGSHWRGCSFVIIAGCLFHMECPRCRVGYRLSPFLNLPMVTVEHS
jgi:hypothetical protein